MANHDKKHDSAQATSLGLVGARPEQRLTSTLLLILLPGQESNLRR